MNGEAVFPPTVGFFTTNEIENMDKTIAVLLLFFAALTAYAAGFEKKCRQVEEWINTFHTGTKLRQSLHARLKQCRDLRENEAAKQQLLYKNFPVFDPVNEAQLQAAIKQGVTFSPDKTVLLKCPRYLQEVTIPGCVTEIAPRAFYSCLDLLQITIPPSVQFIGEAAFFNCIYLTSVTLSNTERIGDKAFAHCRHLKKIVLPPTLRSIGAEAFAGDIQLTDITIPDSVTAVGDGAFVDIRQVKVAPDHPFLLLDKHGALLDTSQNAVLYLPPGFTGHYRIPDGITAIRPKAFINCRSMSGITIAPEVSEIGEAAFAMCIKLQSVKIPDGVKKIGKATFSGCFKLQQVHLPDSIESIGKFAFSHSRDLKKITIPRKCSIDTQAFPPGCKVIRNQE